MYLAICGILLGLLIFRLLRFFIASVIPNCALHTKQQAWKWTNTVVSLVHSAITGTLALTSFYLYPEMGQNLIESYNSSSHLLVAFSIGYFIHDAFDMAFNHRKRSSYELLIHHAFVILCFGLSVFTRHYLGYSLAALVVEVNNIFLHMRQLLVIVGVHKTQQSYRVIALLNIATFIAFRIMVLGWMTRWLVLHREALSLPAYSLGSLGLAVIVLMSIILFVRIFNADFCFQRNSEHKKSAKDLSHMLADEDISSSKDSRSKTLSPSLTHHID